MALLLTKPTRFGFDAEYHKIIETNVNWHERTASVTVYSYLNQETKEAMFAAMDEVQYHWSGEHFWLNSEVPLQSQLYDHIKALPEWNGAVDI